MSPLARSRRLSIVLLAVAVLIGRLVLGYHHHDDELAAGAAVEDCAICWIAASSSGAVFDRDVVPLPVAVSTPVQRPAQARVHALSWPLPPSRGPPALG